MVTPVFLVAARRSGTTLFRLMLNGHPSVIFQHKWESIADAISGFKTDNSKPQTISIEDCETFVATSRDELRMRIEADIKHLLTTQEKTVFGATCHVGFSALAKQWGSAKFIHLIRDPRDIAISHKRLGWTGHYYFAADAWLQAEQDWDTVSAKLDPDQYIEIRYEDLILRPEHELGRVCDFLEIDYTDALFDYVKEGKYSYPKKDFTFRWKGKLSNSDLQLVEAKIHRLMKQRGYSPSSVRENYSIIRLVSFRLNNVWNRRILRIKKMGLSYVLVDKLVRILNWQPLTRRHEIAKAKRHAQQVAGLEKNY